MPLSLLSMLPSLSSSSSSLRFEDTARIEYYRSRPKTILFVGRVYVPPYEYISIDDHISIFVTDNTVSLLPEVTTTTLIDNHRVLLTSAHDDDDDSDVNDDDDDNNDSAVIGHGHTRIVRLWRRFQDQYVQRPCEQLRSSCAYL